ncbi:hypothetical protein BDZ85DRAFT_270888 [Elsinoe ampelina]|uniref:Uncharacterized protein n=1 Tax=Elsinoe ampelina TaxID=302913 RepID=A0A6A6FXL7_9PEZI|nr:hypothetical protein BDZ85DRAFT_270888 [Elsinoe ampelina]
MQRYPCSSLALDSWMWLPGMCWSIPDSEGKIPMISKRIIHWGKSCPWTFWTFRHYQSTSIGFYGPSPMDTIRSSLIRQQMLHPYQAPCCPASDTCCLPFDPFHQTYEPYSTPYWLVPTRRLSLQGILRRLHGEKIQRLSSTTGFLGSGPILGQRVPSRFKLAQPKVHSHDVCKMRVLSSSRSPHTRYVVG